MPGGLGAMIGYHVFPLWANLGIMTGMAVITVVLGAYFFDKSDAV